MRETALFLLCLTLPLLGSPAALIQDTPPVLREGFEENPAEFTIGPMAEESVRPTSSSISTLSTSYHSHISPPALTFTSPPPSTNISSHSAVETTSMEILSQVRGNASVSNEGSGGSIQNVKSVLGSVDVMVPSLRGMELPQEAASPRNRSQVQRLGRTDAPMLNYIFDTYSTLNKHYHRNDRFGGPRIISQGSTVAVDTQARAELDCKVTSLQDKLVSWVRRKPEDDTLEIITIGQQTFTADLRYSVMYLVPDTWRLIVDPARPEDSGSYECQLSTHPPLISKHHLLVYPPSVQIIDGGKDRYYERNSTLSLGCAVRHLPGAQVTWLHHQVNLNDDTTRGGISVRTETTEGGTDSTLQVARLTHSDSGLYTCLVRDSLVDTVIVHVLNESLAELHQGSRGTIYSPALIQVHLLMMAFFFYMERS